MELKHTHRTSGIRDDFGLVALHIMLLCNGKDPTPTAIEEFEYKFRSKPHFEKSLRAAAQFLQKFNPDFKAEPHDCKGQLCEQDGKYKVEIVRRELRKS